MKSSSPAFAIARIFWMLAGPAILFLLTMGVASKGGGWFSVPDLAFLLVLAAVVFARWFEFQGENPQTSTGDPATPADLRRYAMGTICVGLAVWTFANLLGNHWLAD